MVSTGDHEDALPSTRSRDYNATVLVAETSKARAGSRPASLAASSHASANGLPSHDLAGNLPSNEAISGDSSVDATETLAGTPPVDEPHLNLSLPGFGELVIDQSLLSQSFEDSSKVPSLPPTPSRPRGPSEPSSWGGLSADQDESLFGAHILLCAFAAHNDPS